MMTNNDHFRTLARLIADAEHGDMLARVEGLTGYSGKSIVGALQRFVRYQAGGSGCCYLEVGVYQGMTLVSAAIAAPEVSAYGIDNFAQLDTEGENAAMVERRIAENSIGNAHLINADYEDALEAIDRYIGNLKVGVYFVDGPHDYRSQRMCLDLVQPFLADDAIIVVDDSNYRHVRQANGDFLTVNPEYKLLYEAYTPCHPENADVGTLAEMRNGWWNGVNIIVHDPANILAREYPPTLRDRTLYENEHAVHSNKHGYASARAMLMASAILSLRPWWALRHLRGMVRLRRRTTKIMIGTYPTLNTFSAELPNGRFNATVNLPEAETPTGTLSTKT